MVRTRIAPSPTGFPHIGTIYQAIFNKAWALKNGGQFILRLEDTDQKRLVEGSEKIIYESLAWVGLTPDEGPLEGGSFGPYRQSERLDLYKRQARLLIEKGGAYYCFCSAERLLEMRVEQERNHQPPIYDRRCRGLEARTAAGRVKGGEKCVVRLKMPMDQKIVVGDSIRGPITFESNLIDDTVLLKSDGFPTYHLALVVDDHFMEITHPIRGEEWISSYPKHKVLFDYFGWPMPVYTHLPLLRNPDGSKISKRQGHTSVDWYRKLGILPEALVNFLILMVWKHPSGQEIFRLEEFAQVFEFKDISLTGPRFDLKKLEWMNGEYQRKMRPEELQEKYRNFVRDFPNPIRSELVNRNIFVSAPSIIPRTFKFSDVDKIIGSMVSKPELPSDIRIVHGRELYEFYFREPWGMPKLDWETKMRSLADNIGIKQRDLFIELRLAVSGSRVGIDLYEYLSGLDKNQILERLKLFSE